MDQPLAQRVGRLAALVRDLDAWAVRDSVPIIDWYADGRQLDPDESWVRDRRIHNLTSPSVAVPPAWPVDQVRLELRRFGLGQIRQVAAGHPDRIGALNERHWAHRVRARRFAVRLDVIPVRDSDTGYLTLGERGSARLAWWDDDVRLLGAFAELILDTVRVTRDERMRGLLLASLDDALGAVPWPTDTATVTARQAESEYLEQLWSRVDPERHPRSLSVSERAGVRAAADQLRAALADGSVFPQTAARITVIGSAHVDPAWLWPRGASEPAILGQFAGAVSQLDEFAFYRFGQSAVQLYDLLRRQEPAVFARVREFVGEERWELLTAMWAEADLNLPTGESVVRQLLHGQRFLQQAFDRRSRTCWLPDTFGFTGALPQLLLGAGVDYFYTTKMRYNDTRPFPYDFFRWTGLDGSQVLGLAAASPCGYRGTPEPPSLVRTFQSLHNRPGYPVAHLPLGHSSGIGPTDEEIERAQLVADLPGTPGLAFGSVHGYFDDAAKALKNDLPTWTGELYLEAHRGTYTAQGRTKVLHRRAEWELITAEAATSMAHLCRPCQRVDLSEQWRRLLDQQTHDVVTGVGVAEVIVRERPTWPRLRGAALRQTQRPPGWPARCPAPIAVMACSCSTPP